MITSNCSHKTLILFLYISCWLVIICGAKSSCDICFIWFSHQIPFVLFPKFRNTDNVKNAQNLRRKLCILYTHEIMWNAAIGSWFMTNEGYLISVECIMLIAHMRQFHTKLIIIQTYLSDFVHFLFDGSAWSEVFVCFVHFGSKILSAVNAWTSFFASVNLNRYFAYGNLIRISTKELWRKRNWKPGGFNPHF